MLPSVYPSNTEHPGVSNGPQPVCNKKNTSEADLADQKKRVYILANTVNYYRSLLYKFHKIEEIRQFRNPRLLISVMRTTFHLFFF